MIVYICAQNLSYLRNSIVVVTLEYFTSWNILELYQLWQPRGAFLRDDKQQHEVQSGSS
jgi:hypothetical protein